MYLTKFWQKWFDKAIKENCCLGINFPYRETYQERVQKKIEKWLFYNYKNTHEINMYKCIHCGKRITEISAFRLVCQKWKNDLRQKLYDNHCKWDLYLGES